MKSSNMYKWLKLSMMVVFTAMLLITAACGNKGTGSDGDTKNTNAGTITNTGDAATPNDTKEAAKATVYPLTVKDATNTELTFAQAPQKIVTLLPSETEIVYSLGAGEQVVGVDDNSNYPSEVASKEKIGGMEANIEKIVSLKPDLVLASSSMNKPVIDKLRSLKLNVYATDPKTYNAVIEKITQIGAILDHNDKAAEVTKHMQEVLTQVTDTLKDAPKPTVYLEFSPGWTVGKGQFLDELITLAGGTNIATKPDWYEIDPEAVLKANPDFIIYASMTVKEGEKNPILAAIESRPGWKTIKAISDKKLFEVDQDPLVRVGPRLADGLLEVAKKLHPDLIK
ncbi:putative ABC transporter substrate-binding lipoprotein YvrC [Paenibacillus baekrokdamisoli]|uniref:Putative ABC transporter substrate-binding lipoprotein YvrC n=1 Tax=Paenibacillus baekrokdamisoli TaxID=1712516 RepID=A0A3G9J2A1_9BACL|nr:ABC transporter substrate-binding protein [Paenibacillus baekrokdamisoli]MBB3070610.1 iron complex transport system substrate-binding protein [Paenibacillus baekrokdamisoli]BBH19961.1 putative ABC transporter substrate-binding lipoprotein YvrC [Paenibacillus baekrokdamisoli]